MYDLPGQLLFKDEGMRSSSEVSKKLLKISDFGLVVV